MEKILLIIPDMNGEYGIVKNNLRILAGKPLAAYAMEAACKCKQSIDIVVATNDLQMVHLCNAYGIPAIPNHYITRNQADHTTLDPIIKDTVETVEKEKRFIYDIIITLQPTSPLIKSETIDDALRIIQESAYDTIISAINKPHLAWQKQGETYIPQYSKRMNRKYLPEYLVETGSFLICKRNNLLQGSRIGKKVYIYKMPNNEGLEIINEYDWLIAEKELNKKKILIRLDGYPQIGMGHIYRGLLLANMLSEHELFFVILKKSILAKEKIMQSGYSPIIINSNMDTLRLIDDLKPDIIINDILNTDIEYMKALTPKKIRIINLEDLGDGAVYADVVINDLYEPQNNLPNFYWGSKYYCLREEYFSSTRNTSVNPFVKEILISFGGTDPSHITEKVMEALAMIPSEQHCHVTVILGAGNRSYDKITDMIQNIQNNLTFEVLQDVQSLNIYMERADLAISSQGRTMYELAYMTVPTIIMAQNSRELTHEFGYLPNGFINLGLGSELDPHTISETILWLMNCPQIRKQIKNCMASMELEKGIYRVKKLILGE